MADNIAKPPETGSKIHSKINICSERTLREINSRCINKIQELIDKKDLTVERKMLMKSRLNEIFTQSMTENTLIDGEKCVLNQENTQRPTTEFEPYNAERKAWLNSELYPQFDKAVIETSSKRKHLPFQAAQLLAKQCKYEHNQVLKYNAEVASEIKEPVIDADVENAWNDAVKAAKDVAESILTSSKEISRISEDADKLFQGILICERVTDQTSS